MVAYETNGRSRNGHPIPGDALVHEEIDLRGLTPSRDWEANDLDAPRVLGLSAYLSPFSVSTTPNTSPSR